MKTKSMTKRLSIWALVVAVVLMIPFLTQSPWTAGDYIFAGTVLFILATIYEFVTRNMRNPKHKFFVAVAIFIVIGLILAWAAAGPD